VKHTPLQQAQSNSPMEPTVIANPKMASLGLTRSASILSHSSHLSDSSTKARNPIKNMGRDWLGRSRSQPRLPLHPQESYISIKSDRSSTDERTKSPPPSASTKVPIFSVVRANYSMYARRHTQGAHQFYRPTPSTVGRLTTKVLLSDLPIRYLKQLFEKSCMPVIYS
jgi:hypothetical protein